ncbi:MFS transporter [Pseudarthrobacter sulfonivorans]|uniref:MFS transporter n=1 Tax=Pseudarthrobacter sulfonivorans TaxID=121292 RepID=UPI0028667F99|nr:MFS transporter [Pseudarthrobacter sulfonivorans]MDR6415712.1 MHS family alpha-ketoglutarate permease-like MFS transporter [Pseudarthrobacter sulfonivorans]
MARNKAAAPQKSRVVSNVIKGCLGNFIEWFDWFIYASFSIYFAASFFPAGNLTAQLLSTGVVFAVGFLMRPLGGWILGMYADRYGRRNALALSVLLMSGGSLVIALTPSFATIGILAPILLVLARLLQGLSVGGEFGSSATYLSEIATPGKRGFYSSFQYVSIILGQLAALLVMIVLQQLLSPEQMSEWGWRVPFIVGAVAGLGVMILRRGMDESEHYLIEKAGRESSTAKPTGSLRALMQYPRQLLAVFGLALGGTVAFYVYTTYMQKYMVNTSGIAKEDASIISFVALLIFVCLQPIAGALSDRYGRRKVMLFFSVGGTVATVPILTLLSTTTNVFAAFGLMMLGLVFVTGYTALSAIVKAEMFPTKVRALGVGLPHAIVAAVFGGTAEPIALALKQAGNESVFFWYVTGCIALTLVAAIMVKDPAKSSQLEADLQKPESAPDPRVSVNA